MYQVNGTCLTDNRCHHDPHNPRLSPPEPIRKGTGGLPRILSLAAEKAKEWFFHPDKCPPLQSNPARQTRSERREACQVVLEALLSRLDLPSLCVGAPTPAVGFVDVDMKTIVKITGLGQRRCERAISQLKQAGFITVNQPRRKNEEGKYVGLRAVRVITKEFFEWLGLGPMLAKERARAAAALKKKARAAGKALGDLLKRAGKVISNRKVDDRPKPTPLDLEITRAWNRQIGEYFRQGMATKEAQRLVNEKFGFPISWSPGQGAPNRP